MLINYDLLPTLLGIAREGTFARAADTLGLTPSAVSHQMRTLEAQLGFSLFERVGRRAQLSAEAQSLVLALREHLPPIEQAIEAVLEGKHAVRGVLRLGGVLPFSRVWLRPRLLPLIRAYPDLELHVSFGAPDVLLPKLLSGALDLAIVGEHVESTQLVQKVITSEQFWAVCSPHYLGSNPEPKLLQDFLQQRFILYDAQRPMHSAWWRSMFGARAPAAERVACCVANLDEMLQLARDAAGIAVLPNYLVSEQVSRGELLRLGPTRKSSPHNPLHLVWRKSAVDTARLRVVRDALSRT